MAPLWTFPFGRVVGYACPFGWANRYDLFGVWVLARKFETKAKEVRFSQRGSFFYHRSPRAVVPLYLSVSPFYYPPCFGLSGVLLEVRGSLFIACSPIYDLFMGGM